MHFTHNNSNTELTFVHNAFDVRVEDIRHQKCNDRNPIAEQNKQNRPSNEFEFTNAIVTNWENTD